ADRAREDQVAAEKMALRVEGDVRGRVPGNRDALERDPGDLDRLAALEQVVGGVRAARHADRGKLRVALESVPFAVGHVDRSAGSLGEIGDTPDVVEVPVRDQD